MEEWKYGMQGVFLPHRHREHKGTGMEEWNLGNTTANWHLATANFFLMPYPPTPSACQLPTANWRLLPHSSLLMRHAFFLHTAHCPLATSSSPLTTHASRLLPAYCQLATARCPLPTANWLLLLTPHASRLTPSSSSRLNTN